MSKVGGNGRFTRIIRDKERGNESKVVQAGAGACDDASVVIALHDMDLAARLADRVCIVKEGSIIAEGRPEDVLYDEKLLQSAGLELPDVAKLYRELDLGAKGVKKPLSLDEIALAIKRRE